MAAPERPIVRARLKAALTVCVVACAAVAQSQPPSLGPVILPHEFIYPLRSANVWHELRALAAELKLGNEFVDEKRQVLVTKWHSYSFKGLPDNKALGLPRERRTESLRFHFSVDPDLEPARVAIGSELNAVTLTRGPDSYNSRTYQHPLLIAWMQEKLSARLGTAAVPLAGRAERRAEQSRAAMPAGVASPCAIKPAVELPPPDRTRRDAVEPRPIYQVRPIFPGPEYAKAREAVVTFSAEVTEHGTVVAPRDFTPDVTPENFKRAARDAVSLWRFEPIVVDGCPTRIRVTFQMSFGI